MKRHSVIEETQFDSNGKPEPTQEYYGICSGCGGEGKYIYEGVEEICMSCGGDGESVCNIPDSVPSRFEDEKNLNHLIASRSDIGTFAGREPVVLRMLNIREYENEFESNYNESGVRFKVMPLDGIYIITICCDVKFIQAFTGDITQQAEDKASLLSFINERAIYIAGIFDLTHRIEIPKKWKEMCNEIILRSSANLKWCSYYDDNNLLPLLRSNFQPKNIFDLRALANSMHVMSSYKSAVGGYVNYSGTFLDRVFRYVEKNSHQTTTPVIYVVTDLVRESIKVVNEYREITDIRFISKENLEGLGAVKSIVIFPSNDKGLVDPKLLNFKEIVYL